jgi:isoprenylcysteine carboxyl methyltransferase (ICMT) family protein YpbQ
MSICLSLISIICFSITFIRPFAARYEESKAYLPLYIGLSAVFIIAAAIIISRKGAGLFGIDFRRFCAFALPAFFSAHVLIYLFAGTENMQNFRRSNDVANILVLISFVVFVLTYMIIFKNGKVKTSK